ncbi:hypothetical protein [Pustulibacterium marinum]|nr:hypothetical protein [Pustulibacterium marinum]
MDSPIIFVIFLCIIAVSMVYHFFFSEKAMVKRKLNKAVHKSVSEFRDGEIAKAIGKVTFIDEPLIAPISRRPCAFYHVVVERKRSSGNSSSWHSVIDEKVTSRFLIEDKGNYATISSTSMVDSYLVKDHKQESYSFKDAPAYLENYLKSKGTSSEGFLGWNKNMRYREGILEEGELVAVLGKANWKEAKDLRLPEQYHRVLEFSQPPEGNVILSDDTSVTTIKATHQKQSGPIIRS